MFSRFFKAALGIILLAAVAWGSFPAVDIPPSPDRWVTDRAGFLSPAAVSSIDSELELFERQTGHQIIVYIDRTTGTVPLEDWAAKAFSAWKVGRKGLDDGLVLFIMAEDRRVRIEVGYGLEPLVPDITAGRIINDILVPAVRDGDNDGGVRKAMRTVMQVITGQAAGIPSSEAKRKRKSLSPGEMVLAAIAVIFFLILFITNPSLALWLLFSLLSGGRGGGGGGGGSFRGGGGRSGGGGASGSW